MAKNERATSLREGVRVIILGLEQNVDLNGQAAEIANEYDGERYEVRVLCTNQTIRVAGDKLTKYLQNITKLIYVCFHIEIPMIC